MIFLLVQPRIRASRPYHRCIISVTSGSEYVVSWVYISATDRLTLPTKLGSMLANMIERKRTIQVSDDRHDVPTSLNYYPVDAGPPVPVTVGKYVFTLLPRPNRRRRLCKLHITHSYIITDVVRHNEELVSTTSGRSYQSMSSYKMFLVARTSLRSTRTGFSSLNTLARKRILTTKNESLACIMLKWNSCSKRCKSIRPASLVALSFSTLELNRS